MLVTVEFGAVTIFPPCKIYIEREGVPDRDQRFIIQILVVPAVLNVLVTQLPSHSWTLKYTSDVCELSKSCWLIVTVWHVQDWFNVHSADVWVRL